MLELLCNAAEYAEMPVRHNEDKLNVALAGAVRFGVDTQAADEPHVKSNLLLQVAYSIPQTACLCSKVLAASSVD